MRIKSIYINNFKSLIHFKIDLEKFNCIVGLNGSGKSTFLQAVDFLAQLAGGDMQRWLKDRNWGSNDIKFKLEDKQRKQLHFSINFIADSGVIIVWKGLYSGVKQYCTNETVTEIDDERNERELLKVRKGKYALYDVNLPESCKERDIDFDQNGSIISRLSDKTLIQCPVLIELRDFMKNIKSLDLLSPDALKQASKNMEDIGITGKGFPGFLDNFTSKQKKNIVNDMKQFYPNFSAFMIEQYGDVKNLLFEEDCEDKGKITFEARHINDGLIRTLAIVAQTQMKRSLVLFDEIENGINPELMEALVNYLINCNSQVIVTTHNPMILNYIPDDVACKSIDFFYKKDGETKTVKFLSLPEMRKKLRLLGPGEIFVDTNLTELSSVLANDGAEQ